MEAKLKAAWDAMPAPKMTFEELKAGYHAYKAAPLRRKTVVVLAAVLVLVLLCGMGWAKTQYGMWLLGTSRAWSDLEMETDRYDCQLPRELDGVPFLSMQVYGHVPQGASHAEALLNPRYIPVTVEYGYHVRGTASDGECGLRWDEKVMGLSFGTTENELWRYYFGMDERGVWTASDVPESCYTMEYRGIILQIGDTARYDELLGREVYTRWIHWVDEERQVAFSLHETDYSDPDRVVECAKQIIDMNSREK